MNLEHEALVLQYLEEALSWPAEERDARLAATLAHDPALLADIQERLKAAQFVDQALPTGLALASNDVEPPLPEQLGPYKVMELLGVGGMGRVFRAERADGAFERTVAVKLMRKSHVPELLAAQFAREAHILARLEHRNIAQLLDAGVTPDGQSYFVMELVAGRVITQYAADENLSLRGTLQLFLQVCAAVQFAHARLVVHADIKPNNILVLSDGTAKLLDFGVARMVADAEEATSQRVPMALTPGYASPARQRGETSATTDDVFSLGVLLSDLLERFTDAPPDLRAICRRARAGHPNDRYPSVETLRTDIERWLGSFPVQAYAGSWQYITRKFITRNRGAVALAGLAAVAIAAAIAALAFMYTRAEHARASAEERFTELRSLSRFVLFDVYDRLESTPRALPLRRDLAEAAQGYLDRLARDPSAPPAVKLDVIEGLRRLAQVQASPGAPSVSNATLARRNFDRAEALAKELPTEGVPSEERSLILARLALARAQLAGALESDFDGALRSLDQAATLLGPPDNGATENWDVANLRADVSWERANIMQWKGKYDESIQVAQSALTALEKRPPGTPPEQNAAMIRRTRLLDIYAETLYYANDMPRSEQAYRQEMNILKAAYDAEPDNAMATRRYMRSQWALAETLLELKRAPEAERLLASAVALGETLKVLEPRDRDLTRTAIVISTAHARALSALGRHQEGVQLLEQNTAARRKLWDEAPTDWSAARDYAIGVASLAEGRLAAHQVAGACAAWAETIATFDKIRAAGKGAQLDEDHTLRIAKGERQKHCR